MRIWHIAMKVSLALMQINEFFWSIHICKQNCGFHLETEKDGRRVFKRLDFLGGVEGFREMKLEISLVVLIYAMNSDTYFYASQFRCFELFEWFWKSDFKKIQMKRKR